MNIRKLLIAFLLHILRMNESHHMYFTYVEYSSEEGINCCVGHQKIDATEILNSLLNQVGPVFGLAYVAGNPDDPVGPELGLELAHGLGDVLLFATADHNLAAVSRQTLGNAKANSKRRSLSH